MTPGLEPSGDRHGAELLHTVRWVGHSDLSPAVRLHGGKYCMYPEATRCPARRLMLVVNGNRRRVSR